MQERFQRRKAWRRGVAATYVAVLAAYMAWRFTIINPQSLALSIAYYLAECIGFILGLMTIAASWDYNHREPPPAPQGLSVDVLVPTYREPLNIIRRTLLAAKAIDYPHRTYVLDDGARDEVAALARELGVTYLCRPQNIHAKAGNLNFGLALTAGDFVMVLDADHIALPHALDVMLGFFSDPKVAMVQTPQDYYNTDAFQYMNARRTGGLWHDQSVFYNIAQPCADRVNAASCVGTGVVYRRTALAAIGGVPVETVTEDIHTSLRLHKSGFETVYLNEPVAYGVAASDLGEYYKTRHRWGHGNLHALKLEKILTCGGLTPWQRFHYAALGLIYLEGWQQLLLLCIPVIVLATGLQPFEISTFNVLIILLFPFVTYLLLQELGCGFSRYWTNEVYSMARWPVYVASTAGLFGRKMIFRSSSKNLRGRVDWRLMVPQMAALTASLGALGYGIARLAQDFRTGPLLGVLYQFATSFRLPEGMNIHLLMPDGYTLELVLIAGGWAAYNALRVGVFIRKALKDLRESHDFFQFRVPLPAAFASPLSTYGCITDISEAWLRVEHNGLVNAGPGQELELTAHLPAGPLHLSLRVARVDKNSLEGELLWQKDADRDRLANALYSVDWHREFLHRAAYFLTPSDVLLRCFGRKTDAAGAPACWQAVLYTKGNLQRYGILVNKEGRNSLIAFEDMGPGDQLDARLFLPGGIRDAVLFIESEEPLSSLAWRGLDDAAVGRYAVRIVA